MLTALRKIYDFAGNWQGVLKKSVAFSLLHSIFDMFQIAAAFFDFNWFNGRNDIANNSIYVITSDYRHIGENLLQLYF